MLTRYYNSATARPGSFGNNWRSSFDRSLVVTTTTVKGKTTSVAEAIRADGRVLKFTLTAGAWIAAPDVVNALQSLPGGGYRLTCGDDQAETYSSAGRITAIAAREGFAQTLSYDASNRLVQVTDAFGRTMTFSYDSANRVAGMTDPAGKAYAYGYSASGNLSAVQYPDLAQRNYHYESAAFPRALTGITDENGARWATFEYDSAGRAVRSALAGGAQSSTVFYYTNGARDVLDGVGNYQRYGFALIQGVNRRTSLGSTCTACGYGTTTTSYSTSGYVSGLADRRGVQTTFVRDARGLETSRSEAVGTTETLTITTTWHSTFRLPLSITRPGRSTTFTYDSNGRMLTRTEADAASGATRRWTHTYNGQGLLASVDGPRTDVADTTTYSYSPQGNLASVTNAKGQVTQYTAYDAHGRLLSMADPNGLITAFTYDLRGRPLTRNAGGQITSFTYTPSGQLLRTTQPDGTWVERQYDAAQQWVRMVGNAGPIVYYTLDGNGQRTQESRYENYNYVQGQGWTYDALGRVLTEVDAQGAQQWRHAYDANGNRTASTDALGYTATRTYDALDRLRTNTDPLGAATSYTYDARDNLLRVTDPRGVLTQYTYDGLDNLTQESSPDSGASNFGYDAAGNLKTRTWANGKAVAYTLDALNRVTLENYGAGMLVAYGFDGGINGVGRLTASTDNSGGNTWAYDVWGRVVQAQRTTGSKTLSTGYGYDSTGRLAVMSYPSGRNLSYGYDSVGRINAVGLDGQSLLGSITWQPSGAMRSWVQGNGRAVTRSFDYDGRLTSHSFDSGTRTLAYDAKSRIAQVTEPWGNRLFGYDAADRVTAEQTWSGTWSYGWDGNGNRLSQTTPFGSTSYSLAPGTNQLTSASGQDARGFGHDAAGNMIGEGTYVYTYDARNRLASAGGTSYAHDALGRRVLKTTAAVNLYYAHDEQRRVIGEYDDAGSLGEMVWLGSTPVAYLKGGQTYWIDPDQVNAPRALRNTSDQIVWRWRSEAFGSQAAEGDPSGLGAFEFNHRLPGQMFDRETALHHNDHRDYRAHVGRYTQSDPIGLLGGSIPTHMSVGIR